MARKIPKPPDAFEESVKTVFFNRGGLDPAQKSVDLGWVIVGPLVAFPVAFTFLFLLLHQIPVLHDGIPGLVWIKFAALSAVEALLGTEGFALAEKVREHLAGLGAEQSAALWGRAGFAGLASLWIARAVCRSAMVPRNAIKLVKGRTLFVDAEAEKAAAQQAEYELDPDPESTADFPLHPSVVFSKDRWTKHMMLIGRVGSGKTNMILPLLEKILDSMAAGGPDKMILHDIKGDFLHVFFRENAAAGKEYKGNPVALIAPWDRRGLIWNVAADIETPSDAQELAAAWISESKDPMWSLAARDVMTGCVVKLQNERGREWGFPHLAALLESDPEDLVLNMEEHWPQALEAVGGAQQTVASILLSMKSSLGAVFALAKAWPEREPRRLFSMKDWVRKDRVRKPALFLVGNGEFEGLSKDLNSTLISIAKKLICSSSFPDSNDRKIWIVLDEFAQLKKMDAVASLIAVGRSKGVRVILGVQAQDQIYDTYGSDTGKAILAMGGTVVCMGAIGPNADEISKWAGDQDIAVNSLSVSGGGSGASTSQSWSERTRPVIMPYQVSALGKVPGKGCRGLVLGFGDTSAFVLTWPFFKPKRKYGARQIVEAEWIKPGFNQQAATLIKARGEEAKAWEKTKRGKGAASAETLFMEGDGWEDMARSRPTELPKPPQKWQKPVGVEQRPKPLRADGQADRMQDRRLVDRSPPERAKDAGQGNGHDDGEPDPSFWAGERKIEEMDAFMKRVKPVTTAATTVAKKWEGRDAEVGDMVKSALGSGDDDGDGEKGGGSAAEVGDGILPADAAAATVAIGEDKADSRSEKGELLLKRMRERDASRDRVTQDAPYEKKTVIGALPAKVQEHGGEEAEVPMHAGAEIAGLPLDGGVSHHLAHGAGELLGADGATMIAGLFKMLVEGDSAAPRRTVESGMVVETETIVPPPRKV
jgi:hypothetical protein